MLHHIFTGCFAGLEARLLSQVAALQAEDRLRPVAILIGSNILASYLKQRIAERGRAVANIRFFTFLDLVVRLAPPAANAARKPRLPRLGASTILDDVLSTRVPEVFAQVASFAGFRSALLDTFRDLRDAGISAAEFERSIHRLAVLPDRAAHLTGLADLYTRFRRKVEQFHGVDDDFRAAVRNRGQAAALLETSHLLIYGIYDVTGQQADLLSSLRDGMELSYFVPFVDPAVSGFAIPFLEERSRELAVRPEPVPSPVRRDSLQRLRTACFGFGPDGYGDQALRPGDAPDHDGSFALVSAPGESRVGIEIAREILSAVREGVISGFHEAAVILRHPQEQAPILSEALRLRNIPHFLYGGEPFDQRPFSRAVLALAGLYDREFSRQAILQAAELVAAALPDDSGGQWQLQHWRLLTNDPRFLAGIPSWDAATEALLEHARFDLRDTEAGAASAADADDDDERKLPFSVARWRLEAATGLRAGWLALRAAVVDWPESLSWREWAALIGDRLKPLLQNSEDWPAFSTVLDDLACLEEVAKAAGTEAKVLRARMVSLLRESLSSLNCPQGRALHCGVNLIPIGAARGLRFPLVIIAGLEEGGFPARLRQDPLLLDNERSRLGGLYSRLPLKSGRWEEEKLLFDMAARSAGKRVVFVTSRFDESTDRERLPSDFFLRVAGVAYGAPIGLRDLTDGCIPGFRSVALESAAPRPSQTAVDEGEIRLRLVTASRGRSRQALAALARLEPGLIDRPLAYDRARWTRGLTTFDGRLLDPQLVRWAEGKAGPAAGQVSTSRLEEYARCPYLFFLKRVMDLQGWEEPEAAEGLDPLERGRVIHALLEECIRNLGGERFCGDPLPEIQSALAQRARAELDRSRPAGIPDLLWEIEREALERTLENWLVFERSRSWDGFVPALLEHTFGDFRGQHESPPFRLTAGKHTFQFRGRIDRIDVSRDGRRARVIDYKTGRLPLSMSGHDRSPLMGGEKLQIPMYCGAVSDMEGFGAIEEATGEYLYLQPHDTSVVPCSYDSVTLSEASARLVRILEIIGNGIQEGIFFPRTSGSVRPEGHCEFCDFLMICGKDRRQRESLKSQDPAVVRILAMRDLDPADEDEP